MITSFTVAARFRSLFLTTLVFSLLALGCKKSENSDPTPSNLAGNYKLTAYTKTGGGQTIDYIAFANAFGSTCFNDLILTFKADGTITANNPASCNSGTVDVTSDFTSSTWAASGSTLTLTSSGVKNDYAYTQSANKLTLTQTTNQTSGSQTVSVTTRMELTKQ